MKFLCNGSHAGIPLLTGAVEERHAPREKTAARDAGGAQRRRTGWSFFQGFTLIELLAVISIVTLLLVLLFPALGRGTSMANRAKCLNNLRQIQFACVAYAGENNGRFPSADRQYGFPHEFENFSQTLGVYLAIPRDKIMFCPGELIKVRNASTPLYASNYCTYQYFNGGFNASMPDLSRTATAPVNVAMWGCLTVERTDHTVLAHSEPGVGKPLSGMNVAYPDGHGAWVKASGLQSYWTGPSGELFYWPKPETKP
ncbi:hypothetical protein BH09VER1_BH09VER1_25100 [soil metagenome]